MASTPVPHPKSATTLPSKSPNDDSMVNSRLAASAADVLYCSNSYLGSPNLSTCAWQRHYTARSSSWLVPLLKVQRGAATNPLER